MTLSKGELIIIKLLCDIHDKMGIAKGADSIMESIYSGNLWSIDQQLRGLLNVRENSKEAVDETHSILEMWYALENSFKHLSDEDKIKVNKATDSHKELIFPGFDANNEEHYGIATHMIKELGLYTEFAKHDLNSHCPTLAGYRRMLEVYKNYKPAYKLSSEIIIEIIDARHSKT